MPELRSPAPGTKGVLAGPAPLPPLTQIIATKGSMRVFVVGYFGASLSWILGNAWRCVVLTVDNAEYYARRAREERILAEAATDKRARVRHQRLADEYESLARGYFAAVRESVRG